MKHIRQAFAFAAACLTATSALAASLTMLQFGSFETRDEAQSRLAAVTGKHAAVLGKLPTNIREIKLPPDNLTVYRTQAGPVESRAAAQSICAQLASTGDECYIVQTAMISTPDTAPAVAAAKASVSEPVVSAVADAKSEVRTTLDSATPNITSKLSTLSDTPARDPLNRAALSNLGTPNTTETLGAAASTVAVDEVTPQSEPVRKALDDAIENQPKVEADLANVTKPSAIPRRGFWSRLNPFSSNEEPVKPAAPVVKTPEASAAPIEAVASQTLEEPAALPQTNVLPSPAPSVVEAAVEAPKPPTPALEAAITPTPVTETVSTPVAAAPVAAAAPTAVPAAPPAASVSLSNTPIILDNRPVITYAEPLPLPPPPAPLRAQDRELLAAAKPLPPKPEPILAAPLPPVTAANGSVQVEEAKRVPVTQATVAPQVVAPVIVSPPVVNAAPGVSLSPSATEGQRALWAQIGPFASNDGALAYWENYRQTHPDFPVVRVRVTSPYQQQLKGNAEAWLRVGPVQQVGFVNNLCASLAPQPGLRCGMVRDLGTSSPLVRTPGQLPTARYTR